MSNNRIESIKIELTQTEALYILHALNKFKLECKSEVEKDPDGEEDITSMYADDILHLRSIHDRIKEIAVPVFGEKGLTFTYETI